MDWLPHTDKWRRSPSGRKSTDHREAALGFSDSFHPKFEEPVSRLQVIQGKANDVLCLLTKRCCYESNHEWELLITLCFASVHPVSQEDITIPAKLKVLVTLVTKEMLEGHFSEPKRSRST